MGCWVQYRSESDLEGTSSEAIDQGTEEALLAVRLDLASRVLVIGGYDGAVERVARVVASCGELAEGCCEVLAHKVEGLRCDLVHDVQLSGDQLLDSDLVEVASKCLRVVEETSCREYTTGQVADVHTSEGFGPASVAADTEEGGVDGCSVEQSKNDVVETKRGSQWPSSPAGNQPLVSGGVRKRVVGFALNAKESEKILLVQVDTVVA